MSLPQFNWERLSADTLPRINNARIGTNYQSVIPAVKPHLSLVQEYSLGNPEISRSMPTRCQFF